MGTQPKSSADVDWSDSSLASNTADLAEKIFDLNYSKVNRGLPLEDQVDKLIELADGDSRLIFDSGDLGGDKYADLFEVLYEYVDLYDEMEGVEATANAGLRFRGVTPDDCRQYPSLQNGDLVSRSVLVDKKLGNAECDVLVSDAQKSIDFINLEGAYRYSGAKFAEILKWLKGTGDYKFTSEILEKQGFKWFKW